MSHSALLVIAGAVVTCVLAALVFRPTGSAEERRMREERRILRALEGQRRVQAARRAREERRRMARLDLRRPAEPQPDDDGQVIEEDSEAERAAAERERKRQEKERAAALKAQHAADKRASRQADKERKAAAKAEKAAVKAEQARQVVAVEERPAPEAAEPGTSDDVEPARPLTELPLFSWANPDDDPPTPS